MTVSLRHLQRRTSLARFVVASVWLAASLALGSAWAQPTNEPGGQVELESTVFEVGRQLRCPTCVSESVAGSNSGIATEMRTEIRELLQEGRTEREILALYRERYGDWILLEPPREGIHLWVWALPVIAVASGVAALAFLMFRWTRASRAADAEKPLGADDRRRVEEALGEPR